MAGALVAAIVLPWVGGAGVLVQNSAGPPSELPVALTESVSGNSRVLAADGSLITSFYTNDRTPVPSDRIAAVVKQALVDIEDSRFHQHNGLDVQGTLRAAVANVAAGSVQEGGSTLTQQLVKQTLLETADTAEDRQAATEQDGQAGLARKLREARLALALEEIHSKDEILTRYLNTVYFGQGAYGVQAAAQKYFSVDAADLTLPQAAMLAGLVQSPTIDDPITNPDNAQARRNQVLQRMYALGHVSERELIEISASPVAVAPGDASPNGCIDASIGGFFCAHLQQYLVQTLGIDQATLDDGGLTIRTTLRPDVQAAGDQAVLSVLPMGDPLAGMYTAVEPGTGHVLAMSVNRRYGCAGADCESVVLHTAYSQGAGSTYKVFTAAAALERGIPADHTLTTSNPYVSRVYTNNGRPYVVQAFAGADKRTMTMEEALYTSSNPYFMALQDELGSVEGPVRVAERMGMHFTASSADQIIGGNRGSFTLGAEATSPLDLASAYATLAAGGTRCDPTPVTAVLDRDGEPLTGPDGRVGGGDTCTAGAVSPAVANTLAQMMRKDVEPGHPGQTAPAAYVPGHQIAGKTGTTQNNFSIAFTGYTPQYSASVMVLNPKTNQDVGGQGGGMGATIWHNAMSPVLTGAPMVPFPPADPVLAGSTVPADPPTAAATTLD
ncbi:membrane peptidoglycan carboxypeptidase [Geodermatophilus bullaregiensis]|uniref:transglycosylase domain-containing protein n=1 Tax=Geodermatophilus bullaregiensis TaxID=1564160 RepID=UPI0027DBBF97|nr:transglycosylase domain-containing protein [Geodermatophilus bullaregiensis]MBM7808479.1 membrane peptidoglycan carboxypeptidase [Geodermatophilus bullaregiensis]